MSTPAKNLLAFSRKEKETGGIPTLESVSPAYADLIVRREKLWEMQRGLKDRLRELHEQQRGETILDPKPVDAEKVARVSALLGDPAPVVEQGPGHREQALNLKREIDAVAEDLREIEQRIRAEGLVASDIICGIIEPDLRKHLDDVIDATLALHSANTAFTAFADEVNGKGIAWSRLNPIFPTFAGEPRAIHGGLAQFLLEALREGWLDKSRMPKEFAR